MSYVTGFGLGSRKHQGPPVSTPTIVSATSVTTAGGASTITGTGFITGCTATISGTSATIAFVSSTTLTLTVPAETSAGTYNLLVTNPDSGNTGTTGNGKLTVSNPSFVPSSYPGYALEYAPSSINASGSNVSQWSDLGPHALHQTPYSAGQNATYVANALNGFPGVLSVDTGTPSTSSKYQSNAFFPLSGSNQYTFYLVVKNVSGSFGAQATFTNTSNGLRFFNEGQGGVYNFTLGAGYNFFSQNGSYTTMVFTVNNAPAAYYPLGSVYVGRNVCGNGTLSATTFTDGYITLFQDLATSSWISQDTLVHFIGYNQLHSPAQIQTVLDALSPVYNLNTTLPTKALYVDGDSISSQTTGGDWALSFINDSTFSNWQLASAAQGGKTLQIGYDGYSEQLPIIRAGLPWSAIIWMGTNDFANAYAGTSTPATYFSTYMAPYINALKAKGAVNVAVATMLPRGGIFSGGVTQSSFEALREGTGSWNATIRANASTYGYTVIDVASDPNIGQAGDCNNTTYYAGDAVHPNIAGQNIVYTYFKPVLETW